MIGDCDEGSWGSGAEAARENKRKEQRQPFRGTLLRKIAGKWSREQWSGRERDQIAEAPKFRAQNFGTYGRFCSMARGPQPPPAVSVDQ